jgi:hypothetical protein
VKAICLALLLACLSSTGWAQCCNGPAPAQAPAAAPAGAGSTAFCLFEVPGDDGRRKWINLGIVQYVELGRNDLRLYFGGGNFGGGYETRISVANPADGLALMDRIRQAAAACSK